MIGPAGPPEDEARKRKRSKPERAADLREAERDVRGTSGAGVDYSKVAARASAPTMAGSASGGMPQGGDRSAAFDAFMRLQTGQSGRTIEDKINDGNRPTWEQYKKDNEDRLHLEGADSKKMMTYRAELDAERAAKLQSRSKTHIQNDESDNSSSDSDSSTSRKKRKKKAKKKLKKEAKKRAKKKLKKAAARKRGGSEST